MRKKKIKIKMMNFFRQVFENYPIVRAMLTYGLSYPTSNLIAQNFFRPEQNFVDWKEVLRFSFFGGFWVGPTVYSWIRISTILFPIPNLQSAFKKAVVEQLSYGPFAIVTFYYGMNLIQGRNTNFVKNELSDKFWTTYKTGACFWIPVQTLNFSLIPERNRVPVMSVASLMWGTFLSYMKKLHVVEEKCEVGAVLRCCDCDDY